MPAGGWLSLVGLKDIQLPDAMKRTMAKQAEVEREKRAKIINPEGESLAAAALGEASDTMMAHPLALQLRNLQSLVEIGVDKNTTVVFPAPLMSTIGELGAFLTRETAALRHHEARNNSADHRPRRSARNERAARHHNARCPGAARIWGGRGERLVAVSYRASGAPPWSAISATVLSRATAASAKPSRMICRPPAPRWPSNAATGRFAAR